MQGYFYALFSGQKSDIEKLLSFLNAKAQSGLHTVMYDTIYNKYIQLPLGYDELHDNDETEISIGMNRAEATEIGWFSEYDFYNTTAGAVPELAMQGGCCHEDSNGITRHESIKGSSTAQMYLQFSPDRIEVEIKVSCQLGLDIIVNNMEEILHDMILSNQNIIIRQLQLAFDEDDSIVVYHEGIPATGTEEDFLSFIRDMKQFCNEIAHTHPELEITGQFAVEETWSCSGRGVYIYVTSEAGSQSCYAKELSAESEPGIIFDDPSTANGSALDSVGIDFDLSDDEI